MGDRYSPLPDGDDWHLEALFLVGSVTGVLFIWTVNPGYVFQLQAQAEQISGTALSAVSPEPGEDEEVVLGVDQREIKQLNVNNRETGFELAYCGVMSGDTITNAWLTDTVEASRTSATFSTQNCPFTSLDSNKALIHYQPSSLELSETDKQTSVRYGYEYSCVQNGQVTSTVGATTSNLNCYNVPSTVGVEFPEVEVEVVQ